MPPAADVPPARSPSAKPGASARAAASSSPRRQPLAARPRRGWVRRLLRPGLALVTLVLVADALVGENGWFERGVEQERLRTLTAQRERTRQENAALAERIRRLKVEDPAVIEDLARARLGMLKPGEVLFVEGTTAQPADAASTASTPAGPATTR